MTGSSCASTAGGAGGIPRLDWRFLLPDPELDRVGYVGPRRSELLATLRLLCRSVDVLEDGCRSGDESKEYQEDYQAVIACEPSEHQLALAAERVGAGGALVVEVGGPLATLTAGTGRARGAPWSLRLLRSPERLVRRLSALGFEDVRSYWHWPSFDRCTRIIPLHDRSALRHALSRVGGGTRARVVAWLGSRLLSMGLAGWFVTSVSIIGRRAPRPQPPGMLAPLGRATDRPPGFAPPAHGQSVVHTFLRQRWDQLGLSRLSRGLSLVILTPRFRNSSHLIFLLLSEGESEPVMVAKVPRLRGQCPKIELEAARLREINECRSGGFESIPRLVAFEACGERMILLETAVPGRPMDRIRVRRNARQCCEATLAWLVEVQTATRRDAPAGGNAFEGLIEGEFCSLQTMFPAERSLLERARELVRPVSRSRLPTVLEHGDLGHPNLLLGADGRVAVVDWELAELHGLPASDLFFFLAYVARARRGARSSDEAVLAVDRAFFGRRSWARTFVRSYAQSLALSSDTLTPLFIACWARQVAGLARRVPPNEAAARAGRDSVGQWLRGDWRFAVLRHAVEHANQLDWEDLP